MEHVYTAMDHGLVRVQNIILTKMKKISKFGDISVDTAILCKYVLYNNPLFEP
jgi:hypothetical protein